MQHVMPEPMSGCWLWTGSVMKRGYGQVYLNGRTQLAHRAVYEHYRGAIPNGLVLDHRCCVAICVNPDHLDAVTQSENITRSLRGSDAHNNTEEGRLINAIRKTAHRIAFTRDKSLILKICSRIDALAYELDCLSHSPVVAEIEALVDDEAV